MVGTELGDQSQITRRESRRGRCTVPTRKRAQRRSWKLWPAKRLYRRPRDFRAKPSKEKRFERWGVRRGGKRWVESAGSSGAVCRGHRPTVAPWWVSPSQEVGKWCLPRFTSCFSVNGGEQRHFLHLLHHSDLSTCAAAVPAAGGASGNAHHPAGGLQWAPDTHCSIKHLCLNVPTAWVSSETEGSFQPKTLCSVPIAIS